MFWRLWPGNGLKWKFSLQTISGLTRKEREREREPLTSTSPTSPITAFDFDFADLWTHRSTNRSRLRLRRSTNPRTDLRPRAFDLEPRTHKPISLSLCDFDFLCDFDQPTSLWSLIFLLLWWCFGGFPVVWWWVLCGWWWWKIPFSKCYQTHENIF